MILSGAMEYLLNKYESLRYNNQIRNFSNVIEYCD